MKVTELKSLAKERGIKGYSRLKKADLISLLNMGDCYKDAFQQFRVDKKANLHYLVHANVGGVKHAFTETRSHVIDASQGRTVILSIPEYYERYNVSDVHKYTYDEAMVSGLRSGHYGPWD